MPGTGGINFSRPLVEYWFDGSSHDPDIAVTATATNADTGDVGQKKDKNDGLVSFSYPTDFEGEDSITITSDEDGSVIAQFETGRFRFTEGS